VREVVIKMKMVHILLAFLVVVPAFGTYVREPPSKETLDAIELLSEEFNVEIEGVPSAKRVKRNDRGVTNLDIRDAILQLLNVIRDGNKKAEQHEFKRKKSGNAILEEVKKGNGGIEKKIDNISTFLLRMNNKLDELNKNSKGGRGSRKSAALLETLAQESYDMITLLPTYIENTRTAVLEVGKQSEVRFGEMETLLLDETNTTEKQSLKMALKTSEMAILQASTELKDIVVESGHMAESLYERVDSGYKDLEKEIAGLANVEQVLLNTADSVMETKRKIEFGVQQIIFKVTELVQLSGGQIDENLANKFELITRTILANQTDALEKLTTKVTKEIGQVWRQMGIMYGQLSNSIGILEKVKDQTENYVGKTNKNLGSMDNQVEGLTDRMGEVDDNLNYMLGQLSLVVQEFNQVKTGLGEAMSGLEDEIVEYGGDVQGDGK